MGELYINIIGTIVGGLALTILLFIINEYILPKINLTGEWDATVTTLETEYLPYINLSVKYKIHLLQKGYELNGSGEKIQDIFPDGNSYTFEPEKRVTIEIEGYYERKYLSKDKIFLHINEAGRKRESRATYVLNLRDSRLLKGSFISTAACSKGNVQLVKEV